MIQHWSTTAADNDAALTAARLRELLSYDPATGVFLWRVRRNGIRRDMVAGYVRDGYRVVKIDDVDYRASHLAWLYVYGEYPRAFLDHRDLDKSNDRIANLREATTSQNKGNSAAYKGSALGIKGVQRRSSGRFQASIRVNYRPIHLGTFDTVEEASAAYAAAARQYFGEFARAA